MVQLGFKPRQTPRFIFSATRIILEKAMATHSSTLAWKIPWMEEPGRLQSMGSIRVGHDWATSLSLLTFMHWRRKWQPTPEFLPGESQGRRSLVGCHLWDRTESDTTERLHFHALEKEMATHSSVLAWRIPGMRSLVAAIYGVAQSRTQLKWLSSRTLIERVKVKLLERLSIHILWV